MKPSSFRGRKNARRVNALARHQKSLQEAEAWLATANKELAASKKGTPDYTVADANAGWYTDKIQRIKKAIANTEAKVMPQDAAEAVRTKKNRQGFSRQR